MFVDSCARPLPVLQGTVVVVVAIIHMLAMLLVLLPTAPDHNHCEYEDDYYFELFTSILLWLPPPLPPGPRSMSLPLSHNYHYRHYYTATYFYNSNICNY